MSTIEKELLELVFLLSDQIGVRPPQTKDIGIWWINAVKEMDPEYVYVFREAYPADSKSKEVRMMRAALESRIQELEAQGD